MGAKWFGNCVLVVIVSFWSLLTLGFDGAVMFGAARQLAALRYPRVTGQITHSAVHSESGSDGDTYRAQLKYTYSVNGVRYDGDTHRYGAMSSNDGNAARIVKEHPVGKSVMVHYNPSSPGDAILKPGLEGMDLFMPMFLMPFNVVMLCGGWFGWHWLRRSKQVTPFAGFAVTRQEDRLRVCLSDPRLGVAAVAAGGVSFILVFVVGFSTGFNPPMWLMIAAWGLIGAATVAGYRRDHWKVGSAPRELVLDTFGDRLELFRKSRLVPAIVVAGAAVRDVDIKTIETKDSEGDIQRKYEAALIHAGPDGEDVRELLGSWSEEAKAKTLAHGLREWLKRSGHAVANAGAPSA
jgi:hypothetical protein